MSESKTTSIRNLAILAHVDAGKTTLSERLLFTAGQIRNTGDVDDGLATMDYLPQEKDRGITIEAGLHHFCWKQSWFNFMDTPGHIDFSAEVDMALQAVDGAVLVISGIQGVETQTVSAWNKIKQAGLLPLFYINKLDHHHADLGETLLEVEDRLGVYPLVLSYPRYGSDQRGIEAMVDVLTQNEIRHDSQGRETLVSPVHPEDPEFKRNYRELLEWASKEDDQILLDLLEDRPVESSRIVHALKRVLQRDDVVACYCGSARENQGVRQLLTGMSLFLPDASLRTGQTQEQLAQVIRIRVLRGSRELALIRVLQNWDNLDLLYPLSFYRVEAENLEPVQSLRLGDILAVQGPEGALGTGDYLLTNGEIKRFDSIQWQECYVPLLETRIEALKTEDWNALDHGLKLLDRMDPSLQVLPQEQDGSWLLQTVGEVHHDVSLTRLRTEMGCVFQASEPMVRYREKLKQRFQGKNRLQLGAFVVAVAVAVRPVEGWEHEIFVLGENSPTVREALISAAVDWCRHGVHGRGELAGLQIELQITEISDPCPPGLIKRAAQDALQLHLSPEKVDLYEPVMAVEVQVPQEYAGNILNDLKSRGAEITKLGGDDKEMKIFAEVPLKNLFGYSTIGRSISKGTASYAFRYQRHQVVSQ